MTTRAFILANPDDQVWSLLLHFLQQPSTLLDEPTGGKAAPVAQSSRLQAGQFDLPVWLL
jgi:hypothetical protein